jgi:hypothetical protein
LSGQSEYGVGRVFVVLTAAAILSGCSNTDMFSAQSTEQWFNKPFSGFTQQDWGTRTSTKDPIALRPVGPEDLVDANGQCAAQPATPATSQPADESGAVQGGLEAAAIAGGVTLTMTECEVVSRSGAPSRVEIGADAAGQRTAVLTYAQGPAPGVYRFVGGRLKVIDALAEPQKPAPRKKSTKRS